MQESDKHFWHRYTPVYEKALDGANINRILEFGVFQGDSIRWLNNKYPGAIIFGADIVDVQKNWPQADNISYLQVDQGNLKQIDELFSATGAELDLIIEDGSHFPPHQKNCLVTGIAHLKHGGIYILEDLHTSHPEHSLYKQHARNRLGPLHMLLCLEHLLSNSLPLNDSLISKLSRKSLFTPDEVTVLFGQIRAIELYKRSTLPHRCYACGLANFNYHTLLCECGTDLYAIADSMTAVITRK